MARTSAEPKADSVTFRLEPELKAALSDVARAERRPIGDLLRELVRDHIAQNRRRKFEAEARRQCLEAAAVATDAGTDEARVLHELETDLDEFGEWR